MTLQKTYRKLPYTKETIAQRKKNKLKIKRRSFNQLRLGIILLVISLTYFIIQLPIIQNTQDIIAVLDKDAKIKYLGPSTEKILNYKPEDLLGRSFLELVNDEDRPLLLNAIRRKGRRTTKTKRKSRSEIRYGKRTCRTRKTNY